jgi:uncharacterized repeat protein (TIGR01451 family)
VRHALAVLAGLAVGLPTMAALASVSGNTAGGLPVRYVPWTRTHSGVVTLRTPARRRVRVTAHRSRPRASLFRAPGRPSHQAVRARMGAERRAIEPPEPTADLRVSVAAPRTVKPGGAYSYRIRLANQGPATPSAITVRNLLPKGVVRTGSALPDGVGGYAGGRDATLVMPRLAPGGTATVRFDVRVRPGAHGDLVARSKIVYVGGVRLRRPRENAASVSTRVR